MTDNSYVYIISPIVLAVISGIGFLTKYILGKRDEKHREEMEDRNRQRDEIKERQNIQEEKINNIERDLLKAQSLMMSCEHQECKVKDLWANYLYDKFERINKK